MRKKKLGVVGAVGSLAALPLGGVAMAQEPAAPQAQSFSDLLQPISNPIERLQLADEQDARQVRLIPAQYQVHDHHHHHHHNHYYRHNRRWYMSRGYVWLNGAWILRPRHYRHHHHHHHHHHNHY